MEFKKLCELIEEAGYEPRSYSGRSMYGRQCLGVDCDDPHKGSVAVVMDIFKSALDNSCDDNKSCYELANEIEELVDVFRDSREDSMGRGSIIYWPDIVWEDSDESEDEDE